MHRPRIVAAPDAFKGSCTAAEAAEAMLAGARSVFGDATDYVALPLADGGEGTLDALAAAWGSTPQTVTASDALGRPRAARVALSRDGRSAIIEAAEANGLPWVSDADPRPLDADSFGVGELVRAVLDAGAREIFLCLGGSATSDGGAGMLRALGARLLDAAGEPVAPGARGLSELARIDVGEFDARAREARWRIAVDVSNPLTGPTGAAAVFGPQKGATADDIAVIDAGLSRFAQLLAAGDEVPGTVASPPDESDLAAWPNLEDLPGLGAAGGLALGPVVLCGAELVPGADLVAEATGADEVLAAATLVLTGEGRLDTQSLGGKVIDLVLRRTPKDVPVIALVGSVALTAAECARAGLTAAFSISRGPATLDELQGDVGPLLTEAAEQVCRVMAAGGWDRGRGT